jgi:hypothetical protein
LRLLNEASFELTEQLSLQPALPAKRVEIIFQREVNPASLGLVGDQAKRVRFPDGSLLTKRFTITNSRRAYP